MEKSFKSSKVRKLFVTLIFVTCVFGIDATACEIVHEFTFDDKFLTIGVAQSIDGNYYSEIIWDGMNNYGEPGEPDLPYYTANFIVPTLSNNYTINIIDKIEDNSLSLKYKILPGKAQQSVSSYDSEEFTEPNIEVYSKRDIDRGAKFVRHTFLDGDTHIVTVAVSPCAYDAAENKLKVYKSVRIKLNYDICTKEQAGLLTNANIVNKRNIDLSKWVVNPEDYKPSNPKDKSMQPKNMIRSLGEYCIITPAKLVDAFDKLALWKKQKGYNVTVKSVESIINDPQFRPTGQPEREDSAASVRAFIKSLYDQSESGYVYCLLAGNVDDGMPIRKVKSSANLSRGEFNEVHYNQYNECYIPSDIYFSDVLTAWDLQKEPQTGIYTALDNDINFTLLTYVGRLICKTKEEINNYINKLIIYESNPGFGDNGYLDKLFLFAQYDLKNYYANFINSLDSFSKKSVMLDSYDNSANINVRSPKGAEVINELSTAGFSSWMGHGNPASVTTTGPGPKKGETWKNYAITALDTYDYEDSWITPQELGNGLDNMDNGDNPSVAYSISCDITPFDKLEGYNIKYNMGESFTIGGSYGGVALFGNTRVGFIPTSCNLQNKFAEALIQSCKAGILLNDSKELFLMKYYGKYPSHVVHTNNLIGDPEFEIWRGKPQNNQLNVDFKAGNVNINGESLENSTICIYDGNKIDVLEYATDNSLNISYLPRNLDMALCSVWKENTLPFIKLFGNRGILPFEREFITREAAIGLNDSFSISDGGLLRIHAVDVINSGAGLHIEKGGKAVFNSMQDVDVAGSVVEKGGALEIVGETVTLGSGFVVKEGGSLIINM